jgi:hypothetical protein
VTAAARAPSYLVLLPTPPVTSTNTAIDLVMAIKDEIQKELEARTLSALIHAKVPASFTILIDEALPTWGLDAYSHTTLQDLLSSQARVPVITVDAGPPAWSDSSLFAMALGRTVVSSWLPTSAGAITAAPTRAGALIQQEALINAVRRIFQGAQLSLSTQSDPEEGWSRPLLTVETGIQDADRLSALEDRFYQEVEKHETLTAALNEMTVLFL